MFPVNVPVNLIIALLCSSVVEPSVAVKESDVLAIATDTYPLVADYNCLLYTSKRQRDVEESRMPSSA